MLLSWDIARVGSAAATGQAAFIVADGDTSLPDQSIVINGQLVYFNYGVPRATVDGIGRLVSMSSLLNPPGSCGINCIAWVYYDNVSGACNAHYVQASLPNQGFQALANTSGC